MSEHLCQIPCGLMPVISEADFGKTIRPITHLDRTANFNVLIYLINGEMQIVEDGVTYILKPDTIFFLKNGVHHWGEKPFAQGTSWYYVHFEFPTADNLEINASRGDEKNESIYDSIITMPKILNLSNDNTIKNRMKQIIRYQNSGNLIHGALLLWNVLLDCYDENVNNTHHDSTEIRIKRLIEYVNKHYNEKISHEKIQKELGLSFKYLSYLLKESTGKSIHQYQLSMRLERALKLVCESELSVVEISRQTGFYDEFYFSKMFKREFGVSPSKYRANYIPRI